MGNVKPWGQKIWDAKIKSQGEARVIFGTHRDLFGGGLEKIKKQTTEVMSFFDLFIREKIPKNGSILDAGVGPLARFSIEFAKRGYNVDALDISSEVLSLAQKNVRNHKSINFVQGDMSTYEVKKKYYFIFCFETFFHVPPHLGYLSLIQFNKSLKKGGYVLIQYAIENKSLKNQLFELFYTFSYKLNKIFRLMGEGFDVTVTKYSEEELIDLIKRTGFSIERANRGLFLLKKTSDV
jgi:2-polyprenyl-3-methyl-5-hydroxy-6-metoxy-1,4-benzoquinol methylase